MILAMLVTACSNPTPTSTQPSSAEESPVAQPVESGEVVTVQLWGFAGEYEFLPQVIEQFEAEHPNIKIELTDIPEGDYVTKIDTALLANDPPDIGYVYERRWLKAGKFLPLDDFLETEGIDVKDYNVGAMSGNCMYEGKIYCLGTYTGAVLLFYNKTLFDNAGVPYPSATVPMTIDEYAQMIKKLSVPSEDIQQRVWGGDAGAPGWWIDRLTMFNEDGTKVDGFINDEATIHAYQVIADMQKDGSVMTAAESQLMEGTDLLAQGKLATSIIDNAVAIPTLEKAGIKWGAAPPPVEKKGDLPFTPTWTDSYGVFTAADHPDEAREFLAYLIKVGNEIQLELGNLSLNLKLAEEKNYAGDSEGRKEALQAIQVGGREILDVPGFWDVIDPTWDGFNQIVEEGRTAEEVLNEIAPIMQETLDQNWETWNSIQ
jgi:multiple sugar transport system substrate-binding protein